MDAWPSGAPRPAEPVEPLTSAAAVFDGPCDERASAPFEPAFSCVADLALAAGEAAPVEPAPDDLLAMGALERVVGTGFAAASARVPDAVLALVLGDEATEPFAGEAPRFAATAGADDELADRDPAAPLPADLAERRSTAAGLALACSRLAPFFVAVAGGVGAFEALAFTTAPFFESALVAGATTLAGVVALLVVALLVVRRLVVDLSSAGDAAARLAVAAFAPRSVEAELVVRAIGLEFSSRDEGARR